MNGAQDLGGMMGFGPINPEANEPVFHAEWERRAFAMTVAMGFLGEWNLDKSRFFRESIAPPKYLSMSYYEIWFTGLAAIMQANGLVSASELADGRSMGPAKQTRRPALDAASAPAALAAGGPVSREPQADAAFKAGDHVRTKNLHPTGHTRLPRYLRGHGGTVVAVHGAHVFPDSNARGAGEDPQWLYTVRFSARELWGQEHNAKDQVHADLWEPYLERF